jgi:hypothetical protein
MRVILVTQLDASLDLLAARSGPNTVLAVADDLRVFFAVVGKSLLAKGATGR